MILGAYYISQEEKGVKGEGTIFANPREAKRAYHLRQVNIHAVVGISTNAYKDKGLPSNCILVTSMGKIMFNDILPETMPFINDGKNIDVVSNDRIIPAGEERKWEEEKNTQKTLKEKRAEKQAEKEKNKEKKSASTTENGRVGDRPYARGRSFSEDHYGE